MLRNPKRCDATAIEVDGAAGASGNGVCDTEGRCDCCDCCDCCGGCCSCDDPDLGAAEAAAEAVAGADADADDCGEETETRNAGALAYCGRWGNGEMRHNPCGEQRRKE